MLRPSQSAELLPFLLDGEILPMDQPKADEPATTNPFDRSNPSASAETSLGSDTAVICPQSHRLLNKTI